MARPETPATWYARMPPPAAACDLPGATLRCFDGTDPTIRQPPLDENVVAIHLGGAKRVHRWRDGVHQSWDVPENAVTTMPAFRSNRWRTEGVIAFAHLTFSAGLLARLAREEFDRDPKELLLEDRVGIVDPLVAELMLALCGELRDVDAGRSTRNRLFRESLLASLGLAVLKRHAVLVPPAHTGLARGGLAGWQLRRVLDFMTAHAVLDPGLDELVALTGLSRAQFFRAFRVSVGEPPARHMLRLRMGHAADLLGRDGETVGSVARATGFGGPGAFATAFRRIHGVNPSDWRRAVLAGRTQAPDPG